MRPCDPLRVEEGENVLLCALDASIPLEDHLPEYRKPHGLELDDMAVHDRIVRNRLKNDSIQVWRLVLTTTAFLIAEVVIFVVVADIS